MKYMLLMYASETVAPKFTADEIKAVQQDWFTYMKEAGAAGVLLDNNGLTPVSTATTVRVRSDKTLTTDGPFAETHEQLAGYSILNCKDLDEAISWAAKTPMAKYGSVEIRPLFMQQ
jgi:hypothetical protein